MSDLFATQADTAFVSDEGVSTAEGSHTLEHGAVLAERLHVAGGADRVLVAGHTIFHH